MRALRRVVAVRAAAAAAIGAAALTASGCAQFDAALGKQEAVVQFKTGTTTATRLKVRAGCSHIPEARAEALAPHIQRIEIRGRGGQVLRGPRVEILGGSIVRCNPIRRLALLCQKLYGIQCYQWVRINRSLQENLAISMC